MDKPFFSKLQNLILSEHFSWFYNDYKVYKNDNDFQFTHTVVKDKQPTSSFIKYINPILSKLHSKETIQERLKKFEVNYENHVAELARIKEAALKKGSFSSAVNAETNRGKAAGLYIDRKITITTTPTNHCTSKS